MSRTKNIALTAGTLAAGALLATGITGIANAADSSPSSSSNSVGETHHRHGGPGGHVGPGRPQDGRGLPIHSEAVVKAADGTFSTVSSIRGAVTAISSTSITVKAEDGFTATYIINTETKGADVELGDAVSVHGTVSGSISTATLIHSKPADRTS